MTDTEPMYLISESELNELVEDSSEDTYGSFDGVEIGEKVRARGPVAHDPDGLVNYHKCIYKELRNGSEFCHYHDHAVPSLWEHDAAIAAQAAGTEREQILKKLTALKNKLGSAEMSDCSLAVSKKYGAGRIALEGAIKLIESPRSNQPDSKRGCEPE